MSADLSIIVPTFCEQDNVEPLYGALCRALENSGDWEVIFVDDDSSDGTSARVAELARADRRVRLIRRIHRRGLSSACVEGMLASTAPFLAVMDADLQHDETVLPAMLAMLKDGSHDLVVASRYIDGGGAFTWSRGRALVSRATTRFSQIVLKTRLNDPMSGFFMMRRDFFERIAHSLSAVGFKILLDILTSAPATVRVAEVPYVFRPRRHGQSKLDVFIAWEFLTLLMDKTLGRFVPVRFLAFVLNGSAGVVLHLGLLYAFFLQAGLDFIYAQTIAVWVAMTVNFYLNNLLTYRERRFRGLGLLWGLFGFYLACGIGAVANIAIAVFLHGGGVPWYMAGLLGMTVGAVWNYAVTSTLVWRMGKPAKNV